jgi:hypothetical protein
VFATEHRVVIKGAAFYRDRYERGEDGRWRIAHTGYVRTYEAMMSLDDLPSFKMIAKLAAAPAEGPARRTPVLTQAFAGALAEAEEIVTGAPHIQTEQDLVAAAYRYFGLPLSGAATAAMRSLTGADAGGRGGGAPDPGSRPGHRYSLADFGLTGEEVDERFAAIPGYQPSKR